MAERIYAFTDEFGAYGYSFDKPDVTTHFIITSIIVKESSLEIAKSHVEEVRKKYFQTGEMKSSHIGKSKHARRKRILADLLQTDFSVFAVVVDKRQIAKWRGLNYEQSFYKFLNNIVHKELRRAFPILTICSDEIGGSSYMRSFSDYVKKRTDIPNLFGEADFIFENSNNNVLIQLADFISGTLGCVYDASKHSKDTPNYIKMLEQKIIRIELYPKVFETYSVNTSALAQDYDKTIAELCMKQAVEYIRKHKESDDIELQAQVTVLDYLLFRFMNNDTRKYISTRELQNHLIGTGYDNLSTQAFRTKIIGKMRDEGVIISGSSAKKGYKIPANEAELYDFINHGVNIIMPMLNRLKKCRDLVKLGTLNGIDLFEKTEYSNLRRFFDN